MKISLRLLFGIVTLAAFSILLIGNLNELAVIRIGMSHDRARSIVKKFGGATFHYGATYTVQVPLTTTHSTPTTTQPTPFEGYECWEFEEQNVSIEIRFQNDEIAEIVVWDKNGRDLDGYGDYLKSERYNVDWLKFTNDGFKTSAKTGVTQKGKNPPTTRSQ